MPPIQERIHEQKELPFNPGKIVEIDGWPRWQTTVGQHQLTLDIVSVGRLNPEEPEIGIASFVVMEQKQPFLKDMADLLSESIVAHLPPRQKVLLVTVESKGSHFCARVWDSLHEKISDRLEEKIVVFRKGTPKAYMQRPALLENRVINSFSFSYCSITSSEKQEIVLSPRDIELLDAFKDNAVSVMVDDFLGRGGTVIAVSRYFEKLGLKPPSIVAVIGSDGTLYEKSFRNAGTTINSLPQPFPLRLPTFSRQPDQQFWQICYNPSYHG